MAAAQVLVYMGAISVLILFAIMITQSKSGPARLVFQRQWWAGGLAAIGSSCMLVAVVLTAWPLAGDDIVPQEARQIALLLFDRTSSRSRSSACSSSRPSSAASTWPSASRSRPAAGATRGDVDAGRPHEPQP